MYDLPIIKHDDYLPYIWSVQHDTCVTSKRRPEQVIIYNSCHRYLCAKHNFTKHTGRTNASNSCPRDLLAKQDSNKHKGDGGDPCEARCAPRPKDNS